MLLMDIEASCFKHQQRDDVLPAQILEHRLADDAFSWRLHCAMPLSSASTVARIAYLTTDVLVDSYPQSSSNSVFTDIYHALSETSIHKPKVIPSHFGADPGSTILRNAGSLTSFTGTSNTQVLTRLVLHLGEISLLPIVLHIAIQDDLTDVLLFRSAVPFFLL
jgi:sulfite reductase (NADPH) hemoprotein beta-component